jgi:osmotically-inducible protein OsmY
MEQESGGSAAPHRSAILSLLVIFVALAALASTFMLERGSLEAVDVPTDAEKSPSAADLRLIVEVRAAFSRDEAVAGVAAQVRIAVHDGVVILSGCVATVRQRDALKADARAVQDVARVDSRIIAAGD